MDKTFLVIVNCGRKENEMEERCYTVRAKDSADAKKNAERFLRSQGYKFAKFQEVYEVEVEKREWQK